MSSTQSVLDHHLEMFGEGDLDGIMEDYATDAVFVSSDGVLEGPEEIRAMYVDLLGEFDDPSVSFSLEQQLVEDDYAYIRWTAETPANVYEFASDTFVIKDGEIVMQSLAADVSPK
jgi:ketosteroid isomerase-like protein